MKVLLINSNQCKQPWPVLPFGLCSVAAAVEKAGHVVSVLDLCFSRDPGEAIREKVRALDLDVVGVSIRNIDNSAGFNTEFLLDAVRDEVVEPLKACFTGAIVIGGPSVGINGAEMLEWFGLSYAITGDGEAAMPAFLGRLESGESLSGTRGLIIRDKDGSIEENGPARAASLDALAFSRPYRYLDLAPYRAFHTPLPIQTKRGCAYRCSYCTYNRIEGHAWRLRAPERVADEIEEAVKQSGVRRFEFTDSTFNIPLAHAKEVLRCVIRKGLDIELRTMGLNPGQVDEELVDLMKEAGFTEVDLGAESGCEVTLRGLGKTYGREALYKAADLLHARGIAVMWYLLVGGPGETAWTLRRTFDTINEAASPWDLVNVGVGLRVYKGAPIAGEFAPDEAENPGLLFPATFQPRRISLADVKHITKMESLSRCNYFMYDEDRNMPLSMQKVAAWVLQRVAPGWPAWRIFIALRRVQKAVGLDAIRCVLLLWRHGSRPGRRHPDPVKPLSVGTTSGAR